MKSTDKKILILVASLALLLAGCGGGSSTPPPADVPSAAQMAVDDAKAELMAAEEAVSSDMTDMQMAAAYRAIENAANALVAALTAHGGSPADIAAAARTGGNAKAMADSLDMKIADAQAAANMEMMATAAKLYAGISGPVGSPSDGTFAANERSADYSLTASAASPAIVVEIADAQAAGTQQVLSEDKKTMVDSNRGWEGKRYTASGAGVNGTYEAIVYSDVEAPTPGRKFGGTATQVTAAEVQYALIDGGYTVDGTTATNAPLVGGSSFDHKAGVKQFKLPSPNPNGATMVTVPGSFHGVSGTYSCTPGDGNTCAAQVAADGFTLGLRADSSGTFSASNSAWVFKPDDPNARVTSAPDTVYASYGWWIHKSADGKTFTASSFETQLGALPIIQSSTFPVLQGTATYTGGAAGMYALYSATGGTNDAGHFTADATLEADFGNATAGGTVTGMIDNFTGADGMARNWSVELPAEPITSGGSFSDGDTDMTKWTIDGTTAAAAGDWTGFFYDAGTDGVPKVAFGTFDSAFGQDGKMVGAFGVNPE